MKICLCLQDESRGVPRTSSSSRLSSNWSFLDCEWWTSVFLTSKDFITFNRHISWSATRRRQKHSGASDASQTFMFWKNNMKYRPYFNTTTSLVFNIVVLKIQRHFVELLSDFCFTATSADRFYRIDKAQVSAAPLMSVLRDVSRVFKDLMCASAGASPLCDGNLPGRGVYPGPRGTSGEPGSVHGDAWPGGGTHHRVPQQKLKTIAGIIANIVIIWYFTCFSRTPLTSDEQGRTHTFVLLSLWEPSQM